MSGGVSLCLPAVTIIIAVVQVLRVLALVPLTASLGGGSAVCFGGRVLLAHCLSTCLSVPVHSTVNCCSYAVFIHLNDDADPRSWRNLPLSSSSRCTSRLGPLVRKRKGTPRNSSNQVIIKEDKVQIGNQSKNNDTTTNKPYVNSNMCVAVRFQSCVSSKFLSALNLTSMSPLFRNTGQFYSSVRVPIDGAFFKTICVLY